MISLTLQFSSIADAVAALSRMASPEQFATAVSALPLPAAPPVAPSVIAHADRPDVGAAPTQPVLPADPVAAAFGGAVVQAAPLVPAAAPTAQPASIAPSAATAPTAAPAVERDSTGLPWDARIHASTKSKTKEGVWTAKRNTPPELKAQVEADLRGVPLASMPAPATGAALPPAAPLPPAASPAAPLPPAGPVAAPTTFQEMATRVGAYYVSHADLAPAAMQNALSKHGLQHMGGLVNAPHLVQPVWTDFLQLLGA